MGLCILLCVLSRFVSKTVFHKRMFKMFFILYSLSQHVSAYLMAILRWIVQNIKRSFYFYNGSVVFSTIMCESCRQLIAIVFLCIAFLNMLLKYLNVELQLKLLKLYKLSRCCMALNCSCFLSLPIFGVRPVFPYWCRGLIFGATCRVILQCFRASGVCLYYPVFHVLISMCLMLPNAWLLCVYLEFNILYW
jgi:hypothetical protein